MKSSTSDIRIFEVQPVTMVSSSTLIAFSPSGNYVFQTDALASLKQVTSSTQFRFRCQTASKILHIKTNAAVSAFLTSPSGQPPTSCGSYQRLADDNSVIATNCARWAHGKWVNRNTQVKLIDHTMYIGGSNHWNILKTYRRYECDDYRIFRFIRNNDLWEVYVR